MIRRDRRYAEQARGNIVALQQPCMEETQRKKEVRPIINIGGTTVMSNSQLHSQALPRRRPRPSTELPPQRCFSLSHILAQSSSGSATLNLQRLNDSIINTTELYATDVADQLRTYTLAERELLKKLESVEQAYDVVHALRVDSVNGTQIVHRERGHSRANSRASNSTDVSAANSDAISTRRRKKGMSMAMSMSMFGIGGGKSEEKNRLEVYEEIEHGLSELMSESVVQKKRLDTMVERLKKIESRLTKRERLFEEKSPSQAHYHTLFDYGMRDERERQRQRKERERKRDQEQQKEQHAKLDHDVAQRIHRIKAKSKDSLKKESFEAVIEGTPNMDLPASEIASSALSNSTGSDSGSRHRLSDSSSPSKVSKLKMNQYLDIELELDRKRAETNPSSPRVRDLSPLNPKSGSIREFNPLLMLKQTTCTTSSPSFKISDEYVTTRINTSEMTRAISSESKDAQISSLIDGLKHMYND
jgi:hypothetical protein